MYGNFTCLIVEIRLAGIRKAGLRTKIYQILLKNLINSALSYRWGCRDAGKSARNFASWNHFADPAIKQVGEDYVVSVFRLP